MAGGEGGMKSLKTEKSNMTTAYAVSVPWVRDYRNLDTEARTADAAEMTETLV